MRSMLRFRRGRGPAGRRPHSPHPKGHQPCPRSSSPAPAASSDAISSRAWWRPVTRSSPSSGRRRSGRWSSAGSRAASARSVETRIGDVTRPATLAPAMAGVDAVVHLVAIPRDFNGGADLRLVNTEGTRSVVAAMKEAGVRRLVHMGALGVVDDPALHYASSKAKAEALVRDSGLGWTILKPSLQFGEGDGFFNIVAGLVRLSPGVVPVPGDGKARFQPIHVDDVAAVVVRAIARSDLDRRVVRARRSALLDLPRDHPRGRLRAGQAPRDPADADPAHPARRRDRGTGAHPVPGRDGPASPAQARQHRAARPDPVALRLHAAPDGRGARLSPGPAARPGRCAGSAVDAGRRHDPPAAGRSAPSSTS